MFSECPSHPHAETVLNSEPDGGYLIHTTECVKCGKVLKASRSHRGP